MNIETIKKVNISTVHKYIGLKLFISYVGLIYSTKSKLPSNYILNNINKKN